MKELNKKLIEEKCIDHYIMKKKVEVNNYTLNIYSVNIAQLSHLRTMTMYNKLNCYLKNYKVRIEQKLITKLFNEMSSIILKYKLHTMNIKEGSKEEIKNSKIIKDVSKLLNGTPFMKLYLRRYVPKGKLNTDTIFKKRFEKTNFIYCDIIFKEESIQTYKRRVRKTIENLVRESEDDENVILCFQEIYPLIDFLEIIDEFKSLEVIDPKIDDEKMNNDIYKVLFFKSNNILIRRNCKFEIERIIRNDDIFLKFFNHQRSNGDIDRNINQNVKYYIKELDLYLYNIHSYLYCDKKLRKIFKEEFIPYFRENSKKNIIIVGDFNFQMKYETKSMIETILKEEDIVVNFYPNPFSSRKVNYDGIIIKLR
jgi:hypothetical protein